MRPKIPDEFSKSIQAGDFTEAFKLWSKAAEEVLPSTTVLVPSVAKLSFKISVSAPPVLNGQASTLQDRHLWKALCRAREVIKAAPGFRRTTTWEKIPAVLPYLQEPYREQAEATLRKVESPDNAEALVVILHLVIDQQSRLNSQKRINAWKKETRASNQAQSKWLAKEHKKEILPVAFDGTATTASLAGRSKITRDAWAQIYQAHLAGEPSLFDFMNVFGTHMKRSVVQL